MEAFDENSTDLEKPAVSDSDFVLHAGIVAELGPGPGDRGPVSLQETLGAVYGWVWCMYLENFSWSMLYWRVLEFSGEAPQVSAVRAGGIWSGYMSEARGLSWDRKSRYGKK